MYQALPPEIEQILFGVLANLTIGFIIGFLIGYALKKVLKITAIVLGVILLILLFLHYKGIISINYEALESSLRGVFEYLKVETAGFFNFILTSTPLVGGFIAGFILGFKKG
ncbi:MAG: hypothetical protein B6U94_03265 [Thermofilum sp. ex4484_79]|nr:MAG: hypothetical protein B6U94_03265 [Thermofilum sp. ex4484_79]